MLWILRRKRFFVGLVVATTIGAVFCLVSYFNLLYSMQLKSNDFLFRAAELYREAELEEKIVVVSIDDKSLAQLGHFSHWPRSYHAQLIDTLAEAKARVIVFDILFSEPAPGDEELAMSIRNAGNVILPVIYTPATDDPKVTQKTRQPEDFIKPLEIFEEGATTLGHADIVPDTDGVVRRLPIAVLSGDNYEPALSLASVAKYLRRTAVIESSVEGNVLPFAGRFIPISSNNEMLINYIGSPQGSGGIASFRAVSFVDVLSGGAAPVIFQDKIVIIGATAIGLGDTFWTPMGRMVNGIDIHAIAIHTILTDNFLKPAPSIATIVSILAMALLCGTAVLRLRSLWAILLTVFFYIIYFIMAFSFFDNGIMLNMLYPSLAIIGTFVGVNLYNLTAERSEKRELTKTFGRYVSPSVADKVLASLREGELELGGNEHEVTAAFADVRGFTSLSEKTQPEELVSALNVYLGVIINTVLQYDGMINKFGGDSVMAIWNVPIETEGHAMLAIKAAVNVQHAIRELQEKGKIVPKMEFGIGINTGKAVAGNMGSTDRLEYSVIGDTVNTAARLASAAPGGKIWIGADTFERVKDYITAKPLSSLAVKGKQQPVEAYEVVDIHD